jgi:quercetin dioxygenase-like cupin family protein
MPGPAGADPHGWLRPKVPGVGSRHVPAGRRSAEEVRGELERRGLELRSWSNGPGESYGWHEHGYHKTLVCLAGSIVFHTDDGDVSLSAGDVLEIEPGTRHGATVGPQGVRCAEAAT